MTHNNAATQLLNQLGIQGEEQPLRQMPCGYKEPISDGKTLTCGSIYRGKVFHCRDCMQAMLENASDIAQACVELMVDAVNEHEHAGGVSDGTIVEMQNLIEAMTTEVVES
jgi:hypothetical protein